MANKRKREDNDSDSDEIAPGKQILPVAKLPDDFDQEPQDGLQYLFLVRRDARRLPHVTRVRNPYEIVEPIVEIDFAANTSPPNVLPCGEWRIAFQTHFSNLRRNLSQPTAHVSSDSSRPGRRVMPEKKDRDAWWKFLSGYPESTWNPPDRSQRKKLHFMKASSHTMQVISPEAQSTQQGSSHARTAPLVDMSWNDSLCVLPSRNLPESPGVVSSSISSEEVPERQTEPLSQPEVTPTHLQEIDHVSYSLLSVFAANPSTQRMSMHLLMYFTHWINLHLQNSSDPELSILSSHGRWIFALLTKVDDQLSADEMNLLRNLARACLRLIQSSQAQPEETATLSETVTGQGPGEKTKRMSDISCWIVFAAIAGHWGQRDLWIDAETVMAKG